MVWARQLVLVFGNTTQAISAILTGFFGGMAVGSLFGGRLADRVRSPLMAYAAMEGLLAVVVLFTPVLFLVLDTGYRQFYESAAASTFTLGLFKLALAVMALAPATILMGATLPTLTRYLTVSHLQTGRQFARLYSANTLGGILGAALSGYVLIELVGLSGTLAVGALLSGTAGLGALVLASRRPSERSLTQPDPVPPTARRVPHRLVLLVAFVSGCTSLGYQVLWTRLLSSGTDNSTYVFTTILVLFLTGIAVGARFHGIGLGRHVDRLELLGASQVLVGLISVGGVWVIGSSSMGGARYLVVLLATLIMGFALPVAASLISHDDRRVGGDAGLLLGVNTTGVVVGTFLVPFLLIPLVGTIQAVLFLGAANAALGALLLANLPVRYARSVVMGLGTGAVLVALIGPLLLPAILRYPHAVAVANAGQLYGAAEDEIAAVEAGSIDGHPRLWVGGVSMTQLTIDAKLMPLLPLMARPSAHRVLIIAFGMGSSYRTALLAGAQTDAVELVPSVPKMFRYYYPDADRVLDDPRGRLIIADGRNYVELSNEKYDAVVVDPPPPVRSSGTGVLYSREFYQAAASRLNSGGIVMEWMPYGQNLDELEAQVQTFLSVFEHTTYILSPVGLGVFMLGSDTPFNLTPAGISNVLSRPGVMSDLASAPDAPGSTIEYWQQRLPKLMFMDRQVATQFAGNAPVITDDRPFTEYFLLRDLLGPDSPETTSEAVTDRVRQVTVR